MSSELTQGDLVGEKFRVERIVGRGGMGYVVEATNLQLDQKVALKLLAKNADDQGVVERFMREAKAAARLKSEHVARVFDVGKDPVHGPFIVMEMLDGKTLAELVLQSGRVPLHRAVEYVIDACEGLAEAHARGIVHQDVKPGNLFVVTGDDGRPSVKVLDFGIATMRTATPGAAATKDAKSSAPRSQGTPAYLSPEQLRSNVVIDHRTDVWALGCVLYELLSTERPFRATRFTELVTKILESKPDPLPADLDLPAPVREVIDRCLDKDPAKRFSSTGDLALKLLPFARRRAHSSVAKAVAHVKTGGLDPDLEMPSSMPPAPAVAESGPTDIAPIPAAPLPTFSAAPPAKSRATLYALVVFAICAALGVALTLSHSKPPPPPPAPVAQIAQVASTPVEVTADPPPAASPMASAAAPVPAIPAKPIPIRPVAPRPQVNAKPSPVPVANDSEINRER